MSDLQPAGSLHPDANTLISVIVPCYNAEATLPRTVASVLAQTYRQIEVILVDDGSTDSTANLMQGLAAADGRVKLIHQANGGVAAARNAGLAKARGAFIATIDADDLWAPDKLAAQLRLLDDPAVGVVYCWFDHIDKQDGVFSGGFRSLSEGDVFKELCRFDFVGNGSNALARTKLLREIGGYDTGLRAKGAQGCEDWKAWLCLAERTRFAVVKRPLVGYRLTLENMSSQIQPFILSSELVGQEVASRHPDMAVTLREHQLRRETHALIRSALRGRFDDVRWLASRWPQFGAHKILAQIAVVGLGQLAHMAMRAPHRLFGRRQRLAYLREADT